MSSSFYGRLTICDLTWQLEVGGDGGAVARHLAVRHGARAGRLLAHHRGRDLAPLLTLVRVFERDVLELKWSMKVG